MHIEIVQALRCPAPHEESWLVARMDRLEARHIRDGVLGCPVCGAEYPVQGGTALIGGPPPEVAEHLGGDAAVRAAAFLNLTTPGGLVVLAGAWGTAAVDVAGLADGVHLLTVNAPGAPPPLGIGISRLETEGCLPLGNGVARGIALDRAHAGADAMKAAAGALTAGGRMIAPVEVQLPEEMAELARDDRWRVAEKGAATPVIPLAGVRRGPSR